MRLNSHVPDCWLFSDVGICIFRWIFIFALFVAPPTQLMMSHPNFAVRFLPGFS